MKILKLNHRAVFIYLLPVFVFVLLTITLELFIQLLLCNIDAHSRLPLLTRIFNFLTMGPRSCFLEHFRANLFFIILSIIIGLLTGRKLNQIMKFRDRLVISERRLHEAFKVVKEGVFEWAYPEDKVYVSESFFSMCGYDRPTQVITVAEKQEFIHPDDRDYEQEQMLEAISNRTLANFQIRLKHQDGHYFPVHIRGKVHTTDALTQTYYIVGTIRDISSDLAARQNIDQLNSRLNSALQLTGESVFEISCPDLVVQNNISPNVQIAGFSVNSLLGKPLNKLLSASEFEQLRTWSNTDAETYEDAEMFHLDIMLELDTLMTIPVRLVFRKGTHDGQKILIMNVRDLTMEENTNINLMMLKMAADRFPAGLVITRPTGGIYYHNSWAKKMLKDLKDDTKIWNILPELDETRYMELWQKIRSDASFEFNTSVNGVQYEVSCAFLNVASGFISFLFRDQTKSIEREQYLLRTIETEQKANQKRLEVLNSINYELRKPLTGILGFADLLRDDTLSPEERDEYIDFITESGNSLLKLWTSVLELTTLECGMMEVNIEETNLNSILNNVQNTYAAQMKNGVQFRIHKSLRDVDANIMSDESLLWQVFEKLLDNAVKFTKQGWIEAGYTVADKKIYFYVADSGCGIPPQIKKHLFAPFKNDILLPGNQTGTNGLGLTITKLMVELLQGEISVKDTPGGGTRFTFVIPFVEALQENPNAGQT